MTIAEIKQAALDDDLPGFVDALVALAHTDVYWGPAAGYCARDGVLLVLA